MPILFSRSLFSIVLLLILMMAAACSPSPQATATVESTLAAEVTEQATEAAAETATEAAEAATEDSSEATETAIEEAAATESATEADSTEAAAVEATCTLLNLNTVTEDQLLSTMPNFSNRMVREFFEYRPYVSIQQFRREIGKYVDDAQVAEWEQYVYVPVSPNDSDAETLMQLPGVDETIASALTSGRPYASSEAFQTALAAQVSAEDAAQAPCYLASE